LTKSSIKGFGKFRLLAIGCIFALFQCCTPKSSIGSDYGVKPKKIAFLKLIFLPQFAFFVATLFFPNPKTMVSDLVQSLKALESRYSPCKKAKTVARIFFLNNQELSQKGKKQRKKAVFRKNFKCKHNLRLVFGMFYLSTYLQWFTSYCWKTAEQDDKSAFAVPEGFGNF